MWRGDRFEVADPGTPLGMLQRGRGAAYLWAREAPPQEAAVDFGMECFHSSIKDLRGTSERADIRNRKARVAEDLGGPSGREELGSEPCQTAGDVHHAGLIGHADQCTLDRHAYSWPC